jgi:hypothetical protein
MSHVNSLLTLFESNVQLFETLPVYASSSMTVLQRQQQKKDGENDYSKLGFHPKKRDILKNN